MVVDECVCENLCVCVRMLGSGVVWWAVVCVEGRCLRSSVMGAWACWLWRGTVMGSMWNTDLWQMGADV